LCLLLALSRNWDVLNPGEFFFNGFGERFKHVFEDMKFEFVDHSYYYKVQKVVLFVRLFPNEFPNEFFERSADLS